MKLTYSKKILLLSLAIFAGTLALDVVFTRLLLGRIVGINDKVKQLEISSREREKELALKDSIAGTKAEREKLETYFVGAGNAETVRFTEYLEKLALEAGVTQRKTLEYEPAKNIASSEVVTAIRYRFNVSGRWANVYSFLQAVENLPKLAYLNSLSLNLEEVGPGAKVSGSGKIWSLDLDFSVVKLKQ